MSAVEQYEDIPPPRDTRSAPARRSALSSRVPPHNLAAEESLLGAMLLSKDAIAAATEVGLAGEDFYKPAHGHIFTAICGLYSRGEPVDPVTVAEVLRRQELLDAIGGTAILVTLQAATPATTSAGRYARIIEEHALLRRLIGVAGEIAESAYGVPDDVTSAIDRAESMVYEVAQRRVTDSMAVIGSLLDDNLNRLEALYERGEAVTGVPTGYADLDDILAGLQPANLVVVGARPAMGKCLARDARIVDPATGALRTIEEIVRAGDATDVPALWEDAGLVTTRPVAALVDDGAKPTWTVRTSLGREVTTTATHPFLTPSGWAPLADVRVGDRIAVPTGLPFFGHDELPDAEVALLGHLLADDAVTGPVVRVTTASDAVADDLADAASACRAVLTPDPTGVGIDFTVAAARGRRNPVVALLRRHGLAGLDADERFVPEAVFRLPRRQLAGFLARLFATDASAWWTDGDVAGGEAAGGISYRTVSPRLARDVQHLLLRFGVNAALRRRQVVRAGRRVVAHELEVRAADDIVRFGEAIGIVGKEHEVAALVQRCRSGAFSGASRRPVPAATSGRGVALLDEPEPVGDLRWDEVVAIEPAGEQPVYDLTVADLHNFVADDVFVHNTAFSLGLASHAAVEARRPVLVFSLEMSQLEVSQRILCAEARVDSSRVRTGRLTEADWGKISHSVGRLADAPIYIDDNANVTVMDIRAKARRMRSQLGDLGLVIIDYIQLMTGRSNAESRQVEVSEISRNLKILARELETPVVALAQLNRQLEQRADKRPMLSDLRESGCLTAATRLLRADTGAEVTLGELLETGATNVPVWSLDDRWRLVPATLTHAFPSGTKPTFRLRLASGRTVEATGNHRFRTFDGWAALDELEVGSRLAVPRCLAPPLAAERMDDDELVDAARRLGDGDRGVPAAVFRAPDDQVAAFLRHAWATAASISSPRPGPSVHLARASWSRRLVDDLQLLLLRLGVESRISVVTDRRAGRPVYELRIDGAEQQRRFLLHVGIHGERALVPAGPVGTSVVAASATAGGARRASAVAVAEDPGRSPRFGSPPRPGCSTHARTVPGGEARADEDLLDLATSDVLWDRVVAIEPLGEQPVFDATVLGTHNFVANGIIAHNSLEQDADIVLFLYRDEVYNPDSQDRGTAEVIVAKHRNGPVGKVRLAWLDHYTKFANMAKGV